MNQSELISKLQEASGVIAKSALRGSSNYVIVNPSIYNVLNSLERNYIRKDKINRLFNS
jgi:hypothetical protein